MSKSKAAKTATPEPTEAAAAPAPAVASEAVTVRMIAFDKVEESKLNPRKTRDPVKVAELAESIALEGILQPLKFRPHPKKSGKFEIVFGGSRLAAVALLIKAGRAPANYKLPATVEKMTDAQLIKLALVENIQRADMSPLEEGEAFVRLRKAGGSTEDVARELGKSQRWVQQRIALVEKLAPKVQEALRAGELTTWQAQALCKGEAKHQVELLSHVRKGWISSAEDIVERLTAGAPSVKVAHFKPEDYKAAGGALIEDEEGKDGGPWFADRALFEKLQRESIDKAAEELAGKWAWVKVMSRQAGEHFDAFEFNKSKDQKKAGAVIEIARDWKVTVHTGLVPKASASSKAAKAGKKAAAKAKTGSEPPTITQPLMLYAKQEKTKALQVAVGLDALQPGKAALALTCIALMGANEVTRIQRAEIRGDDEVLAPVMRDAVEGFRGSNLHELLRAAPRGKDAAEGAGVLELKEHCAAAAFERLWEWPTDNLLALFACLIAVRSGTFAGYTPTLGDNPLAYTVARLLGVDMAQAWGADPANWSAYLALLKKSRAVRLVAHMPGLELDAEELSKAKTDALVQQVNVALELHPDQRSIVPPELVFADGRGIEAAINKAPPKRQAELTLKPGAVHKAGKAKKTAKDGKAAAVSKGKGKAAKAAGKGKAPAAEVAGASA